MVGGDASDPEFTTAVAQGARDVYQTLSPGYSRWLTDFPALQAGVTRSGPVVRGAPVWSTVLLPSVAAAQAHGAQLVSLENVYLYGRPAGRPLTETRATAAHTRKGRLRASMAQDLLALRRAGPVWHLSNDPHTRTTRPLVELIYSAADQPRTRLRQIPSVLLHVAGLANPTVRELLEMQYQFEEPFVVDSSKIVEQLGARATPIERSLVDTGTEYRRSSANSRSPPHSGRASY